MSKLQQDFTQGSISSHLIKFALPYLLANLLQALYSVADMMIVSWMCGTNSMSGVNIGGQITQMIMMLVSGLTVGGTVLVGQYYGARQDEEVKRTIGTMLSLLTIMGIVLMAIMRNRFRRRITTSLYRCGARCACSGTTRFPPYSAAWAIPSAR